MSYCNFCYIKHINVVVVVVVIQIGNDFLFFFCIARSNENIENIFLWTSHSNTQNKRSDLMDRRIKFFTFHLKGLNGYWIVAVKSEYLCQSHLTWHFEWTWNLTHFTSLSTQITFHSLTQSVEWMRMSCWWRREWFKNSWIKPQSALRKCEYFSLITSSLLVRIKMEFTFYFFHQEYISAWVIRKSCNCA